MSRTLEIPESTFDTLKKVAEAGGTTPLGWIEARLAEARPVAVDLPESESEGTLADLFAGRIGRIRSGMTEDLSQRVAEDFADHLEEKRKRGCL
jgi:hypothetical protein